MPTQDFTTSGTLAVSGKTNLTGDIDVGSSNANVLVPFTIPDGDLANAFSGDNLIHITLAGAGGTCFVVGLTDSGLAVNVDDGSIGFDDFSWSGASSASVSVTPMVTLNWDAVAAGLDTKQKRGSAINLGMPGRQWLAEPSGTISLGPRQSVLTFCSSPLFGEFVPTGPVIRGCVHINDYAATEVALRDFARTIVEINDFAVTTVTVNDEAC